MTDLELQRWKTYNEVGHYTSWQAAERFARYDFTEYLDVGCGRVDVHHRAIKKKRITTDFFPPADYVGPYQDLNFDRQFQAIWCSHVLEHTHDVSIFLKKIFTDLEDDGVLCITVPPAHPEFMGGHVSLWTEGLLIYRLVLAGFNCSQARVGVYDRNISVIVRKKKAKVPTNLIHDHGDIEKLAPYFPVKVRQFSPMKFGNVRWNEENETSTSS